MADENVIRIEIEDDGPPPPKLSAEEMREVELQVKYKPIASPFIDPPPPARPASDQPSKNEDEDPLDPLPVPPSPANGRRTESTQDRRDDWQQMEPVGMESLRMLQELGQSLAAEMNTFSKAVAELVQPSVPEGNDSPEFVGGQGSEQGPTSTEPGLELGLPPKPPKASESTQESPASKPPKASEDRSFFSQRHDPKSLGLDWASDLANKAARNDIGELGKETASGLAELAKQTGPVGKVFGEVAETGMRFVSAFSDAAKALIQRGEELRGYNADLASSYAISDRRRLTADIEEANQLGSGISKLNNAQTNMEMAFREIMLPIKKVVLDVVAPILEAISEKIAAIANIVGKILSVVGGIVGGIFDVIFAPIQLLSDAVDGILETVGDIFDFMGLKDKEKASGDVHDWLEEIYKQHELPTKVENDPRKTVRDQSRAQMNIPIFQGN